MQRGAILSVALVLASACASSPPPWGSGYAPQITSAPAPPPTAPQLAAEGCDPPDTPAEAPTFAFDSAKLTDEGRRILDRVAACATRGPWQGAAILLIGYADARGAANYNYQLGLYRATAAKNYLLQQGVFDPIKVESRGEMRSRGTDPSTRRLDRRVEVQILPGPAGVPRAPAHP